jgi:putative glycerol-1-phosphate prenyltransferase
MEFKHWRHVFKLDQDKELDEESLEKLCESGTDAIIIGGTQGISFDNTIDLLARVRRHSVPCILEISNIEAVVPGFDFYLVPLVVNADKPEWIFGRHIEGLMEFGPFVKWSEVAVEGYIILNPSSEAAHLTEAKADIHLDEIKAYSRLVDQMLKLPILYLEYSGAYGDPKVVAAVRAILHHAQLFYGGGIQSQQQAAEMAALADTIVVGNIIYEDIDKALKTVETVKQVHK